MRAGNRSVTVLEEMDVRGNVRRDNVDRIASLFLPSISMPLYRISGVISCLRFTFVNIIIQLIRNVNSRVNLNGVIASEGLEVTRVDLQRKIHSEC